MTNMELGSKAKPFNLPGVDGKNHDLEDYKHNKALAVIFSCNHCPYVQAWEDRMIQIQSDYQSHGVQLIAINSNDTNKSPDDSFPKMKDRAELKGINFPYLFDEPQSVALSYGAERTPEVFIFDQTQTLRYHGAIDDNYDEPDLVKETYLRDALDAIIAGKEPSTTETTLVGCTIKWR